MAIITSYPDDALTTDDDKFLTSNSAGTTVLTPASNLNKYLGSGWTIATDSWSFSSYTAGTATGVINAGAGANTRYSAGMKIKFTQPTLGIKYARITAVTSTTITAKFAGGTILSNEAITLPFYSTSNAPNGYPFTSAELSGDWWEEIGRTTLSSTSNTVSVTFPAKKYLRIAFTGLPSGGTIGITARLNNDSTASYAVRISVNGASDGTAPNLSSFDAHGAIGNFIQTGEFSVTNISNQEKLLYVHGESAASSGAGNVPDRRIGVVKWANTSSQITRFDMLSTAGTGIFAVGSEVIVLGHD